jgi:hypothetical protein
VPYCIAQKSLHIAGKTIRGEVGVMGMEIMRSKWVGSIAPLVLALLAALIGAEYQRATIHSDATLGSFAASSSSIGTVPAELDPAFMQKLADRMRGPYERSR